MTSQIRYRKILGLGGSLFIWLLLFVSPLSHATFYDDIVTSGPVTLECYLYNWFEYGTTTPSGYIECDLYSNPGNIALSATGVFSPYGGGLFGGKFYSVDILVRSPTFPNLVCANATGISPPNPQCWQVDLSGRNLVFTNVSHGSCPSGYGLVSGACVAQLLSQTITVTKPAPASAEINSSFTVAATATSGLPVGIFTSASGGCSGSGTGTATITMTNATTTCAVLYYQSGDGVSYNAAPGVINLTTATLASQTITVTTPSPLTAAVNSSFTVAASASSGLPVSITTRDGCTGSGNGSAMITMNNSATQCTVAYDQAGDGSNYNAAPEVTNVVSLLKGVNNDLNGDSKSDVLFLNTGTGATRYWVDAAKSQSIYVGTYNLGYSYQGTGDFDGDGKADLLFVNTTTNAAQIWLGADKAAMTYPGAGAAGYSVAATCDTDGNGKDDIVWYNPTTGSVRTWPDAVKAAVKYPGIQNTAFAVVACADFDGDGKSDLFWRNAATGADQVWLSGLKSSMLYPGANTDLTVAAVGAGDIDGDGKADMVWYVPSTYAVRVWLGGLKSASSYMGTGASGFTPKTIGDYDGDGKADLFWGNDTTLETQIWPGVVKASAYSPGISPTGFAIQK